MPSRISRVHPYRLFHEYPVSRCCAWHLVYGRRGVHLVCQVTGRFECWKDGYDALLAKGGHMPVKPVSGSDGLPPALPHADPCSWVKQYPLLCSYLVDGTWPDGSGRRPAKLFISANAGSWEFTLKEQDLGLILCASVEDPNEGLLMLESLLDLPTPPWRADPWSKPRSKKK